MQTLSKRIQTLGASVLRELQDARLSLSIQSRSLNWRKGYSDVMHCLSRLKNIHV